MRVPPRVRVAIVVAAASLACGSDEKAGVLLDIDAVANVDRAAITSLAVTVDTRTQVYSTTTLPGTLGIRTSAGSHHIVVFGPAASPIARWEGTVVAVSSGTVPSTRVLLEAIATSYAADAGRDALVGAGGNADAAWDFPRAGGTGGAVGTGGVPSTGGSLGMDADSDVGDVAASPGSDADLPDDPGTGGLTMTGGRIGSGGVMGTGGAMGTGGMSARGGAGGGSSGGAGGSGGRATGGAGASGAGPGGKPGTGGSGSGGVGVGGSSIRTDAGVRGDSGGTTDGA